MATKDGSVARTTRDGSVVRAIDALVDAVTRRFDSGVRDAKAAVDAGAGGQTIVGKLDVASEDCSQMPGGGLSGAQYSYAQHAYPGKTAAQLSQVRVMGHAVQASFRGSYLLPAFPFVSADNGIMNDPSVFIQDGMVAVRCGLDTGTLTYYDSVTFTLVE